MNDNDCPGFIRNEPRPGSLWDRILELAEIMWRFAVERSDLFLIREDAISAKEFTLDHMIYYRDSFA